jgi:hypothetical protein
MLPSPPITGDTHLELDTYHGCMCCQYRLERGLFR